MNILYLGHYRENTDLGVSSVRFIHGLKQIYDNIAIRPLYQFQNAKKQVSDEIKELESKSFNKYDCVIQHTLPNLLSYNKNFGKNIGVVDIQTFNLAQSAIPDYLNLMDEIYVRSNYSLKAIDGLVNRPVKIIYEPFDEVDVPEEAHKDKYSFFANGSTKDRYNLYKIVLSFLSEFSTENNVELILHGENFEHTVNLVQKAYDRLRIPSLNDNKIAILNEPQNEETEKRILQHIDCAINIDKADHNGIFTIKNLLYNNIVITQNKSASCDFANQDNAIIADEIQVDVEYLDNRYDNSIFSIYELYYDTTIASLKKCMREAFGLTNNERRLKQLYIDKHKFSYKAFAEALQ